MARAHRVLVLLGSELRAAGSLERWPTEFRDAFAAAEREAAAVDCIRHRALIEVLGALHAATVRSLVFKGAALAYTHYAAPHVRPRTDVDVLISADDLPLVERVVASLGYVPQHETGGDLVSYQRHFGRHDRHGVFHALDVHWKISNRHALADCVSFEELWADRQRVQPLGRTAATVSDAHALVLALVHRAGHHPGSDSVLWLWDVHVLARGLGADGMCDVARFAASRGLAAVVTEGLALAKDWFATPGVAEPLRLVNDAARERSAVPMLSPRAAQAGILRHDLRALPTWRQRGRLVREHLFPSAHYIRGKYRTQSALALPALYAWRIVTGAPRWLRRHDDG